MDTTKINILSTRAGKVLVSACLILALALAAFLLFGRNVYIKNLGSSTLSNDKLLNTISVKGEGRVFAKPDMLSFNVAITETASTSEQALKNVNTKINQIMGILKNAGIADADIQTANLSIYPDYEYRNNIYVLVGQRASQTLSVKVHGIDKDMSKASNLIDSVSKVENVQMSSINFDLEDRTQLQIAARESAFKEAKAKAEQLASLGGIRLTSPVSMSDASITERPPTYYYSSVLADSKSSTSLAAGQLEVVITLDVIFGTE